MPAEPRRLRVTRTNGRFGYALLHGDGHRPISPHELPWLFEEIAVPAEAPEGLRAVIAWYWADREYRRGMPLPERAP